MLDGLWKINIAGMRARGMVLFRNGAVPSHGETIGLAGSCEEQGDAMLAMLDVVLNGPVRRSEAFAEWSAR